MLLLGCGSPPLSWPESPLYRSDSPPMGGPLARAEALDGLAGHYAHYDVVGYEEPLRGDPMRTFVVSYGFTDFKRDGDRLIQTDRFCHAEHRINREGISSSLNDAATQAIIPPSQEVTLTEEDGRWVLRRPATPTLIGVAGDPAQPLPADRAAATFVDADADGHPGVTVEIQVGRFVEGQVYLARREIFETEVVWMEDGSLVGSVTDRSEQLVAGASSRLFDAQADPHQVADAGLNPLLLLPLDADIDTCEALMAQEGLFPDAPEFL